MGELEARQLNSHGFAIAIDEPYQHFQFAGRADLLAWDLEARALLHVENKSDLPDLQDLAGSYNAKRAYLPAAIAQRLNMGPRGWASVTHVLAVLWSSAVLHVLRLRPATFTAICPSPVDPFEAWWAGDPPAEGVTSSLVILDPNPACPGAAPDSWPPIGRTWSNPGTGTTPMRRRLSKVVVDPELRMIRTGSA
jgi:hypothetical protein